MDDKTAMNFINEKAIIRIMDLSTSSIFYEIASMIIIFIILLHSLPFVLCSLLCHCSVQNSLEWTCGYVVVYLLDCQQLLNYVL